MTEQVIKLRNLFDILEFILNFLSFNYQCDEDLHIQEPNSVLSSFLKK